MPKIQLTSIPYLQNTKTYRIAEKLPQNCRNTQTSIYGNITI